MQSVVFVADLGEPGLTLNAKLYDAAGVQAGPTVTAGFVDLGNGRYSYRHASVPDGHEGTFEMYDADDPTNGVIYAINPDPTPGDVTAVVPKVQGRVIEICGHS